MLCLTRYLGLIIGDLIPEKNTHWKFYRCLRKILGLLIAPQLTNDMILRLQNLIEKHNFLYLQPFGALKPKMHFLLHYGKVIQSNGPVNHFSAMKFERENKKIKEIATGTLSNINLS